MPSIFFYKPAPSDLQRLHRTSTLWSATIWLPAIVAVLCVVTESTPTFSSAQTSGWLHPIFESIVGPIDGATWEEMHHLIRKSAHFVGYGLVCLAFLRAWLLTFGQQVELSYRNWRLRSCVAAILSTALVASGDEIHQTFLPSRTGQFSDVVIDTCGATFLCLVIWFVCWRRRTWEALL